MIESVIVLHYADDTILFLRRLNNLEMRLRRCFLIFSLISGLRINLHKSNLFGVSMEPEVVQELAFSLDVKLGPYP